MDILRWGPNMGELAHNFCWHDRPGIELRTELPDDRVIATYRYRQLRPCNFEVWAEYFKPPIRFDKKGHRI
jgi:hypothetical protein